MPVSEYGVPEHLLRYLVDGVDRERACWGVVSDAQESELAETVGEVVRKSGEQERAPEYLTPLGSHCIELIEMLKA